MMTEETINEMVRIIREADRMCDAHKQCAECMAAGIDCNFNATSKDVAKMIQIVDAWSIAHPEEEQPKKRTRMEAFLELIPRAVMRTDIYVPIVRPCEIDAQYRSMDCTHVNCYECMEKYWNEEVDG